MMNDWKKTSLPSDATIKEAMLLLDRYGKRVVLVVNGQEQLLGTVTDGDIRRAFLSGLNFEASLAEIMNSDPVTACHLDAKQTIHHLMYQKGIMAIPVLDQDRKIVRLETIDDTQTRFHAPTDVVLMAGGFGKRLHPLTQDIPKPMLPLGKKPILENIIEEFVGQGFNNFYISLHYKSNIIQDYFGDGQNFSANIHYVEESTPLGTAGALQYLRKKLTSPFILMNADLLVKIPFEELLQFHLSKKSICTMCVKEYTHQVPFGVVDITNERISGLLEKPAYQYFINAGIYCLDEQIFNFIEDGHYMDMPQVLKKAIAAGHQVSAFPIMYEYWTDIGSIGDYEKAQRELVR